MIPIKYNTGSLRARRTSTAMTIFGIAIVIAVTLALIALYHGVMLQLTESGSPDLVLVLENGSDAELSSAITNDALNVIRALPGQTAVATQMVTIFKLPKKGATTRAGVTMRGVSPNMFALRPYIRIIDGRVFKPGSGEVIVSKRVRDRFANMSAGDSFQLGPRIWAIVGVFDGEGTAFDSEMWCDVGYLQQVRKRETVSSVLIKPIDRGSFQSIVAAIRSDLRLQLQAKSERQYYNEQTSGLAAIRRLVELVTFFMVSAAIFGTMNTMFSAVASRGRELAALRALGFRRRWILVSMIFESAVIALLGGIVGILLALPVNFISTGTFNGRTMSEVEFSFKVDASVAAIGIAIALASGIIGGLLPALRAATMPITKALREI